MEKEICQYYNYQKIQKKMFEKKGKGAYDSRQYSYLTLF